MSGLYFAYFNDSHMWEHNKVTEEITKEFKKGSRSLNRSISWTITRLQDGNGTQKPNDDQTTKSNYNNIFDKNEQAWQPRDKDISHWTKKNRQGHKTYVKLTLTTKNE